MSKKNKAISGVLWVLSEQISVQILNFIVQIILARMLMPKDFGTIAMMQIFMAIGLSLTDSGMTSSLVRSKEVDNRDYSSVFYLNLLISFLVYVGLYISAPFLAIFLENAVLTDLTRVYALAFPIKALSGVQLAILVKEMKFKQQMIMQLPSTIISGFIGIVMAYLDYGVWSLVILNLSQSVIFTLQLWIKSNWRPTLIFDKERLLDHFNFGYKLTIAGLLNAVFDNFYNIAIGKYFSPSILGLYNRAETYQLFPSKNLATALERVTYPYFSSIQDDEKNLKNAYRKTLQIVFFILTPALLIIALLSEQIFRIILSDRWDGISLYYQSLLLVGILHPFHRYNLNILRVKNRTDLVLKLNIVKKIILVVIIALTLPHGIWYMIAGQSIFAILSVFINTYYSGNLINYPVKEQLKSVSSIFATCLIIPCVIYISKITAIFQSDTAVILANSIIASFSYLALSKILKLEPYEELLKIIKSKITINNKPNIDITS